MSKLLLLGQIRGRSLQAAMKTAVVSDKNCFGRVRKWKSDWCGFKSGREVLETETKSRSKFCYKEKQTNGTVSHLGKWGNRFFLSDRFYFFIKKEETNICSFQGFLISYSSLKNIPIFIVSLRLWNPFKQPCLTAFLIIEIVLSWYYGNTYSYSSTSPHIYHHYFINQGQNCAEK